MITAISRCQLVALACAGLLGSCGGESPRKPHGHQGDGHGDDHGDDHGDSAAHRLGAGKNSANAATADLAAVQRVKIAPEMIRDLRVTTARVEARVVGERTSVLAELHVNEDAYAEVASPTPARVVRVLVKAGDQVKLHQPLIELASAEVTTARAALAASEARLRLARQALERKTALAAERVVAEREVLEAQAAVTEAEAARSIAAAAMRSFAGAEGGAGLLLRAPVAGTVIDRKAVLGQLADPSRTLFTIGDLSKLWLVAHVFERDAVRVQLGQLGTATFAALPGTRFDGPIVWIGREVETESRTIAVRLEIANPGGVLRPGMSATVLIPVGDTSGQTLSVPIAAMQRVADQWAVFTPRGAGTFEVRPIGRGRELGGEVEVLSGLAVGDEVVVDGAFLLKAEFDKVRGEGGDGHDH